MGAVGPDGEIDWDCPCLQVSGCTICVGCNHSRGTLRRCAASSSLAEVACSMLLPTAASSQRGHKWQLR